MSEIRTMRTTDKEAVQHVCLNASSAKPPVPVPQKLWDDAVLQIFCNYYVDKESENSFVAVDENDVPFGYIVCAKDFDEWKEVFEKDYVKHSLNPLVKGMAGGTIESLAAFKDDYPAHLHIDILPGHQGEGIGTKLMNALTDHLKEMGVKGVMLGVASDNTGAIRFYERLGFVRLAEGEAEINYGLKI